MSVLRRKAIGVGLKHDGSNAACVRGEKQSRPNIVDFEVGPLFENSLLGPPASEKPHDRRDGHPHPANAGLSSHFQGIDGDALMSHGL